ncbi:MAG TPA: LuxR C-terminal-related transcriptional regulator [Acidimicrobiales bacterium]|nr:LuxR C-terminal-related transcriptional regulator [Acidimicrobiales bacterium]
MSDLERRRWVPDPGCRIVACVDVRATEPDIGLTERSQALSALTARRVERCVRPTDWTCHLGPSRLAIAFGNGGHRVPPSVLGSRIARAVGDHVAVGQRQLPVAVAIGISAGPASIESRLTGAALATIESARRHSAVLPARMRSQAIVSVSNVAAPLRFSTDLLGTLSVARVVRRMAVLPRYIGAAAGDAAHRPDDVFSGVSCLSPPAVLVVDPSAPRGAMPRLAVEAVAAMTRRLGARTSLTPSSDPQRVLVDLYVTESQVAVIVLQHDTAHGRCREEHLPVWEATARLVRLLTEALVPVVAVSVGGSAAAVASCVEEGAVGLLDPDELPSELMSLGAAPPPAGSDPLEDEPSSVRIPAPFSALASLTPSERTVLFYMMEGRAAAEIAEVLVLSISTVRSHIRSIRQKLKVNSQIAAVAVANGTHWEEQEGA